MPRKSRIDAICGLVWLPVAAFLAGCDEGSAVRGPQSAEATPGRVRLVRSEPTPGRFKPVAAPDDPAVPVAFPGEVAGWVKAEPARAVLGRELDEVLTDPDRLARWQPFNLAMVATSRYQRDAASGVQTARVYLVQAHDAEDAYGLFSVESVAASSVAANAVIRVDTREGSDLSAWKGRFFLRVSATFTGSGPQRDEAVKACRDLVERIRFALPDADPPAILDVMPPIGTSGPDRWLVRSTRSLIGTAGAVTSTSDSIDELLGLNRDTLMAVARYPGQAGGGPNRPWLVRYDGAEEARAAHRRYRAYLDRSTDPAAADTMLATPKGRYLIGTWSAEEESISRLLPRIRQRLPD